MIDTKLISLLRCPVDGSQLELAAPALVEQLNAAIERGELRNRSDQKVTAPLDGGLVGGNHSRLYPIRNHIPSLIVDEAIAIEKN